jgi:hypothetical protein
MKKQNLNISNLLSKGVDAIYIYIYIDIYITANFNL